MRHRVKGRKLGRTASHRAALLRSLATSLFRHKRIKTTIAKAKEARGYAESLITKAKKNDLHARRVISEVIKDRKVLKELFDEIVPKVGDRPGGYTRVVRLGRRLGDAAELAILELVDFNEVANETAAEQKEKREAKAAARKEKEAQETPEAEPVAEEKK